MLRINIKRFLKKSKLYSYLKKKQRLRKFRSHCIYINYDSVIGDNTIIGKGTIIGGTAFITSCPQSPVTIGNYCVFGHNLRIRARNHYTGYPNMQGRFQSKYNLPTIIDSTKGGVTIGNTSWIADNVMILAGVRIGDGAVIGAGSVVTKNIPSYAIAVGNPARVIKYRFSNEIIDQLLEIKWWNWSEQKIKRNLHFFEIDLIKNPTLNIKSLIID